jgi:hypothetical protein
MNYVIWNSCTISASTVSIILLKKAMGFFSKTKLHHFGFEIEQVEYLLR